MTATRREVADDWVEQWQAFCAGTPASLREDLDAPHGRVRIHGGKGRSFAATFVRGTDGAVVPLGTGDYPDCVDASVGVLEGRDPKFPPPAVIARRTRRFFIPVDGVTVVGALEIFGGVVLLGVNQGIWTFLYHDDRRTEWLGPRSSTFDLDAWLRDHPVPAVGTAAPPPTSVPGPAAPPTPAPPTASAPATPATPPAPVVAASSTTTPPPDTAAPTLRTPPTAASPTASAPATPAPPPAPVVTASSTAPPPPGVGTTPQPETTAPPAPPAPPRLPGPPPPNSAERRRQAEAAQKDSELREQQRRVVVGPDADPVDGPSDSDTVRACLLRLSDRAPAGQAQHVVEWFARLVIALGEAGYFGDPTGRKADIAATFSRVLGVPVCARMLGEALRILHRMGCCLINLANEKWWTLKLNGLADGMSSLHRAFVAETGTGFWLRPVKVAFWGRRAVRWEVPRLVAEAARCAGRSDVPVAEETGVGQGTTADPRADPATGAPTVQDTATSAKTGDPPAVGVHAGPDVVAALRHQLTVAHGLAKLAQQRHEEERHGLKAELERCVATVKEHARGTEKERADWHGLKAELEQRVAMAEEHAHGTAAELSMLTVRFAALEQTTEQTIAALVGKLERATAALVAATDNQEAEREAERQRRAAEAALLTRHADELRRRELDLVAERDQHAAEAARLARVEDEQRRRELDLAAERDRHSAEVARLARAEEEQRRRELDLTAERDQWIAERDRAAADDPRQPGPDRIDVPGAVVACVAWTIATLTFAAARQASARSGPAHGTAARTPATWISSGRDPLAPAARLPWIDPAESTSDLGTQGPRGPPLHRS